MFSHSVNNYSKIVRTIFAHAILPSSDMLFSVLIIKLKKIFSTEASLDASIVRPRILNSVYTFQHIYDPERFTS